MHTKFGTMKFRFNTGMPVQSANTLFIWKTKGMLLLLQETRGCLLFAHSWNMQESQIRNSCSFPWKHPGYRPQRKQKSQFLFWVKSPWKHCFVNQTILPESAYEICALWWPCMIRRQEIAKCWIFGWIRWISMKLVPKYDSKEKETRSGKFH